MRYIAKYKEQRDISNKLLGSDFNYGDYKIKLSDLLNKPDSVSLITRDNDHLS